jgi:phosphosulfolactate synthase (CoM biosynthesis protein A)
MSQAPRPQAQKTPAEGVWRHTTDNNYAARFKYFTFDAQNVFTGWTIIAAELNVDDTGDANTGSATIQVYDTNGNLVATGKLMFEAADPDVFAWYIKNYGADVNLFVDHSQIVQLECLRAGIWGTKSLWDRVVTYKE